MVISENKLVKLAIKVPPMSPMKGSHSNVLHTTFYYASLHWYFGMARQSENQLLVVPQTHMGRGRGGAES